MFQFDDYKKSGVLFFLMLVASLVIALSFTKPCFGVSLNKSKPFPLIIMGGHWSAGPKPGYSDLSRVCNAGFTHVFSYFTAANIDIDLAGAINLAVEFASTVKKNCPGMGLAIGIPRRWIYEGRLDLIEGYVSELKANNVAVDYWFSDELIHQMVDDGVMLKDAERKAREAIDTVKKASSAPYIWVEPGNYNPSLSLILDVLNGLPAGIKSYDEYVISRTGRLSNSKSQEGFNSALNTLHRLKSEGNVVYPVCEINHLKNMAPLEEELAAISIPLVMNGADGLVFYEERWTTIEILQSLKKISGLITFLNDVGIKNFVRTNEVITSWVAKSGKRTIKVVLNTTGKNIKIFGLLPERSKIVWPLRSMDHELKPMDLLVSYYE